MKMAPGCYQCLRRLVHQAAELATDDVLLRQRAIEEAMKILDDEFSFSQISLGIAARIHKTVREATHNPDPYRAMKEREMKLARELYSEPSLRAKRSNLGKGELRGRLQLAAAANALDFFKDPGSIRDDIRKPASFVIDDSDRLEAKLRDSFRVLYLADIAGEL